MSILNQINTPQDIKRLTSEQIAQLCDEVRKKLIHVVSKTGGHLASNLGVVELTAALLYSFKLPEDQIVWDVGHQCYTYKLLTGRQNSFGTLRQSGGLSGFPKPYESDYDVFVAGHSSTSISAALGLAEAKRLKGDPGYEIAVIGDGAFSGGMVYEALNNAGKSKAKLIVVLNDNNMSISKSVGSMASYFSDIRTKQSYFQVKSVIKNAVDKTPVVGHKLHETMLHSKSFLKTLIYKNNIFEDLGFDYLGPVDGHNFEKLCAAFERAKRQDHPCLIHIITQKGKGFEKAEQNPGAYHGVGSFDLDKGNPDAALEDSFSTCFGKELAKMADDNRQICAITAAMKYGTGLEFFSHRHRDRFYDVGIAEEHAVTFASGLATNGMLPVFAVYSTFLQRGTDQLIHDVGLQQSGVTLAIDRAGLVGQDGETHQGIFDVPILKCVYNMRILAPSNYAELKTALHMALKPRNFAIAMRYPKGREDESIRHIDTMNSDYELFKLNGDTLLVTYGKLFANVYAAARQTGCDVLKLNCIWPLNEEILLAISSYNKVLFYEEGIYQGGISQDIQAKLLEQGFTGCCKCKAIFDPVVPQMSVEEGYKTYGFDVESIVKEIEKK